MVFFFEIVTLQIFFWGNKFKKICYRKASENVYLEKLFFDGANLKESNFFFNALFITF